MQNRFVNYIVSIILIISFIKIFFSWIFLPHIIGGDWPYYSNNMLVDFHMLPPLWMSQTNGLGGVNADFPIYTYLHITIGLFVNVLHIPWNIVYKVTWFWLSLILGIFSIIFLYKSVKKQASLWELTLASFLYVCNSYFLMLAGGGQMGILLAYAISPLLLGMCIRFFSSNTTIKHFIKGAISIGLLTGVEILFDPRITYLTVSGMLLYCLFYYFFVKKTSIKLLFLYWSVAFFLVFLLHSFWILPFYLFKLLSVPSGLTSSGSFAFFSFADFPHAFAFLHPNWPENIFGKVYFLQPEFLIYPLFAFLGLLLTKKIPKELQIKYIYFGFIGLIGVFLAKGVHDPFGQINIWLFNHFPGFNLFRDPTKYYLFIATAYSVMIPFSLSVVLIFLKNKIYQTAVAVIALLLLLFPVRQGLVDELTGTFQYVPIPQEYTNLATFISSQKTFYRTLWVPNQSRFRFTSNNHPMLIASDIFASNSASTITNKLKNPPEEKYLQDISVKYIIIPDDTTKEIFISDRKYDDKQRQIFIRDLDTIPWLQKKSFNNIVVYKLQSTKNHFWLTGQGAMQVTENTNSNYTLNIDIKNPQILVFAENYHPGWIAKDNNKEIKSIKTKEGLNSFYLPAGKYTLHIVFIPDQYQIYFEMISLGSLIFSLVVICLI